MTAMKLLNNLKPEDLINKTIFIRVDFNVPLQQKSPGRYLVEGDDRIRRFLDTSFKKIHELTQGNCRIIIGSHLGRPQKNRDHSKWDGVFNLQFVCAHFETLLKKEYEDVYIVFPPEGMDSQLKHSIEIIKKKQLPLGGIKFMSNLRYLLESESTYRDEFIEDLSEVCDVYINCAFGTCHRESRSITTLPKFMRKKGKLYVAGLLLNEEISHLGELGKRILKNPEQTAIVAGGAKISDKIGIIKQFVLSGVARIILGGKMVNTFLLAMEREKNPEYMPAKLKPNAGEEESFQKEINMASEILKAGRENKVEIVFPADYKVASDFTSAEFSLSDAPDFDRELQLDIGPMTIENCKKILFEKNITNVFWNGPLGVFDHPSVKGYAEGSVKIAQCLFEKSLRDQDALVVLGGGDSAAIVQKFDLVSTQKWFAKELYKMISQKVNRDLFQIKFLDRDLYTFVNYFAKNFFISTGGGASLEFLEAYLQDRGGKSLGSYLPGTRVLMD